MAHGKRSPGTCHGDLRDVTVARLTCARCKKTKSEGHFDKDASRPSGRYPWCKHCRSKYTVGRTWQDPEAPETGKLCPVDDVPLQGHANRRYCSDRCKNRAAGWSKKWGLSVTDYRALLAATGGRCPICDKVVRSRWNVDHDHKTMLIHGICCTRCNIGLLAYSNHDVSTVRRLLEFLTNPPAAAVLGERRANAAYMTRTPSNLKKAWDHANLKARPGAQRGADDGEGAPL